MKARLSALTLTAAACLWGALLAAYSVQDGPAASENAGSSSFTIAVIPDTQNYVDFRRQRAEGFALDGQSLFLEQMRDIAARKDVVFVAAVGDVWQHTSIDVDPAHEKRGRGSIGDPQLEPRLKPTPKALSQEIPGAIEGYKLLSKAGLPFGVAPGNHDYDAVWSVYAVALQPGQDPATAPVGVHVGGLDNFRSVFGSDGDFFRDRDWYVDSFRGGANSAQVFTAGGYRFLHIALEMSPDDNVLRWAESVMQNHAGYPTIVTTHDYLNTRGERRAHFSLDLAAADPGHHNNAEQLWEKLISAWDQVFLVLCGHHHGQSRRIDDNRYGNPVYQVLADYQGRGQAGLDAGQPREADGGVMGLGDGWYRLMHFDLDASTPTVRVQTWSSHYRRHASGLPTYAEWYRDYEQPGMGDSEFVAADEFILEMPEFRKRFARARLQ